MIKIRRATIDDIPGITKVHVDAWQTTYKNLLPDPILRRQTYERRKQAWTSIFEKSKEPYFHFVAENEEGEIIGFIDGGMERTEKYMIEAEVYAFYILEGSQRQGIGSRLLHTLVSDLKAHGYTSLMVWILEDNPSRKFYEDHNAEIIDKHFIAGYGVNEVAFAWKDLREFD